MIERKRGGHREEEAENGAGGTGARCRRRTTAMELRRRCKTESRRLGGAKGGGGATSMTARSFGCAAEMEAQRCSKEMEVSTGTTTAMGTPWLAQGGLRAMEVAARRR